MENASQALIIAAGVLIGILILSLGVALINIMGGYAESTQNRIDENKIAQFNDKFLKYNGLTDLNIQDVITVKNYALENNKKHFGYNYSNDRAEEENDYIDVYYGEKQINAYAISALILGTPDEQLLTEEMDKLKNDTTLEANRFTCEVKINSRTGKVFKVYFYEK